MRSHPYRYDGARVVFVETATGCVVRDDGNDGRALPVKDGRIPVAHLLSAAVENEARRVFLVGPQPKSSDWLDDPPGEGWSAAGHFRELRDPCGRWAVDGVPGSTVEVRRIASWLGEGDYDARRARDAVALVHQLLQSSTHNRVGFGASPAAVGQSLWAYTVSDGRCDEQLPREVADLIRSTSPQHRQELLGACYDGCDLHAKPPRGRLPALFYFDAQFMYAACVRELGCAPAAVIDIERVAQAFYEATPYARARYRLSFTVPDGWTGPGLLPVKHPNGANWHYPNRPGVTCETWADACEVGLAAKHGWPVRMLAVIKFKPDALPLDRFGDRIVRLRELATQERSNPANGLAAAAFRSMFIRTIGAFHSRGRDRSYLVPPGVALPDDVTDWTERPDGSRVFTRSVELTGNAASFLRPELSAQVWARARMRVAVQMMQVDPAQLVGVWGDALYLTADVGWTAGRPGQFRLKGSLAESVARPKTLADVLRLRRRMEEPTE